MQDLEESLEKIIPFKVPITTETEEKLLKHLEKKVNCYSLYSPSDKGNSLRGVIKLINLPKIILQFKICKTSIYLGAFNYGKEVGEKQLEFIADLERETKNYLSQKQE